MRSTEIVGPFSSFDAGKSLSRVMPLGGEASSFSSTLKEALGVLGAGGGSVLPRHLAPSTLLHDTSSPTCVVIFNSGVLASNSPFPFMSSMVLSSHTFSCFLFRF